MKDLLKITMVICMMVGITSCENDIEIQTNFPFEVKTLPVPTTISEGQTVEIRCQIVSEQKYHNEVYKLRYFQFEGDGVLRLANQEPFLPNDLYTLPDRTFRLYYTSQSIGSQSFDIWIADSSGKEEKLSFEFNAEQEEEEEE